MDLIWHRNLDIEWPILTYGTTIASQCMFFLLRVARGESLSAFASPARPFTTRWCGVGKSANARPGGADFLQLPVFSS